MIIKYGSLTLEVDESAMLHFKPYLNWFDCAQNQLEAKQPTSIEQAGEESANVLGRLSWLNADAAKRLDKNLRGAAFVVEWLNSGSERPLQLFVETLAQAEQQRSLNKKGPLNQAIGKKSKTLLDATGGWGNDSQLLAAQGYKVYTAERHPLLAMLLHSALDGSFDSFSAHNDYLNRIQKVFYGPVDQVLSTQKLEVDCVYFDPMFPAKRKKSAKSNKQMQFCQALLNGDSDASDVVHSLIEQGAKRVVVKRPNHADSLVPRPSEVFSAKLVHYDVYLNT